jgi:hypothetical protein
MTHEATYFTRLNTSAHVSAAILIIRNGLPIDGFSINGTDSLKRSVEMT